MDIPNHDSHLPTLEPNDIIVQSMDQILLATFLPMILNTYVFVVPNCLGITLHGHDS